MLGGAGAMAVGARGTGRVAPAQGAEAWPRQIILEYPKEYRGSGKVCYSGIFRGI